MQAKIGSQASIPNPALQPFGKLVGEWSTSGSHPSLPDLVLRGRVSFEWMEGGAFLMMRSELDDARFPQGIAVFGSDDGAGAFFMLYFDQRGVSRRYDVSITGDRLKWWRDDAAFSQRFQLSIGADGTRMVGRGEMARDGGDWEGDLSLTYHRVS